jgi:L-threonylcarbamoyladenylate synthase
MSRYGFEDDELDEDAGESKPEEGNTDDVASVIAAGGVGVFPTDTLYGLIGSALLPDAVDRIYELKRRDPRKSLIVLISDLLQLEQFGIELSEGLILQLQNYWPGAYSIILPSIDDQFEYLSRGTDTIAFRLPDKPELIDLINQVGPLVAPSANVEGLPPATTVEEAQKYFGSDIEFYVDGGDLVGKPSTILRLDGGGAEIIRD